MTGQPQCGRCKRPVIKAVTFPGMRPIRLDMDPSPTGRYELDLDAIPMPTARQVRSSDVPQAVVDMLANPADRLYTPHVETCPALNESMTGPSDTTGAPSAAGSGR